MASSFAHQPRRLAVLSIELGRRRNTPEHAVRPHAPNRFDQPCMFLFLFEEAPIHFVEIALQQRERLAERVDLGGPEALGIDTWVRRLFAATGDTRVVVSDPHAPYAGGELRGRELTTGDGARIGSIDFNTWIATRPSVSK